MNSVLHLVSLFLFLSLCVTVLVFHKNNMLAYVRFCVIVDV